MGGAFQYSRRGLRLRRRGAYGIHRASGPRRQGLCRKVASLRSGGPPIGGQDRDGASYRCSAPYTLSRFAGLPLKGKREIWREKQGVIYIRHHFGVFPLWWLRHHLPAPLGSVSLDSQSPTAPCESSSLATTSWWHYGCLAMGPCFYRKT